jgi:hypothetical protein
MGAFFYCYFTAYQENIATALRALRETEFKAGRYLDAMEAAEDGSMYELKFPPDANSPAPGPVHVSSRAALDDFDGTGTRSILDILYIADEPDLCTASPLPEEDLLLAFGTTQPTRDMVEKAFLDTSEANSILDRVGRGEARYVIVHDGDKPSQIFFMGYSFD